MALEARDRLPLSRKIFIGSGDFGLNLYWQSSTLFLLYFYTEVLGLSPSVAGTIYMAALIWDAIIDPVVGGIADRTSTRWGRYRPYLAFGAVPLALAYVLVFALPSLGASLQIVLATISHFLFRTLYAVVAIPYASMFARVTQDSGERATMAGIRMVFALISAIAIAATTLPLARLMGGGVTGWTILAAAYGAFACLFLWAAAMAAGGNDQTESHQNSHPGISSTFKTMVTNRALMVVLGVVLVSSFANTFFSKNILYYFKYVRHDAEFGGTTLAIMAGVAAIFAPIWAWASRRWGKRNALLCGLGIYACGLIAWFVAHNASYGILTVSIAFIGAGSSAIYVCFWAMLPDTVEYGEWRSGVRTESLIFGFVILMQKAALGLGAGALGLALGFIGFTPNADQSTETLDGLLVMMVLVPLTGAAVTFLVACIYPINSANHAQMVDEIARRKHGVLNATGE